MTRLGGDHSPTEIDPQRRPFLALRGFTPPRQEANWPPNAHWLVDSSCGVGEPFQKRCHRVVSTTMAWDFSLGGQSTTPGNRYERHVLVRGANHRPVSRGIAFQYLPSLAGFRPSG